MSHEREYSSFQRAIQFPEHIIANKVEGTMKDGILQLRIPKKEPTSTKLTEGIPEVRIPSPDSFF